MGLGRPLVFVVLWCFLSCYVFWRYVQQSMEENCTGRKLFVARFSSVWICLFFKKQKKTYWTHMKKLQQPQKKLNSKPNCPAVWSAVSPNCSAVWSAVSPNCWAVWSNCWTLAQTARQFAQTADQTAEHLFPNKYDVFVFWVKNDVVLVCFCFMYFVMLSYLVKKTKKQHQSQIDINTGEMKQWKFCNPIVFKKPKNYMCLFCFFGSYICLQYRVSYDIWLKNAQRDKGMKYGCWVFMSWSKFWLKGCKCLGLWHHPRKQVGICQVLLWPCLMLKMRRRREKK